MALAVPCRLWLGGVVSPVRDLGLIQRLVDLVRLARRPGRTLLIGVDGLASYVTAFWRAFRAGTVRLSAGLTVIDPLQLGPLLAQPLAHHPLHQRQPTRRQTQQVHQSLDALLVL